MPCPPHLSYFRAGALIAGLLLASPHASAKVSSGRVHLNGAKTESTLVKFAVSRSGVARVGLDLTSYGMYEDEQELRLRVYADDEWPAVKRAPLCGDKIKLAERAKPIVFDFAKRAPHPSKKKGALLDTYTASVQLDVRNPPRSGKKDRDRYFYFTVDDCSLERFGHDNKIPDIFYTVSVENGRQTSSGNRIFDHLPADEDGIGVLLMLTLGISGALALFLLFRVLGKIGGEVHVAVLVVQAACLANGLSALCELVHRAAFSFNGRGNYAVDALSSYFESLSDAMIALLLLSIGSGWTLPTDLVGGGLGSAAAESKMMTGMKTPVRSLWVTGTIVLVHVGLAQWGRTFDDDFDTYHALEHPPGRALLVLRFVLGLIFVTAVGQCRSGGRCPPSLMGFLTKFGLVGLSYFASLPGISFFVGSVLPYHQRHQALKWGAAAVQLSCLASLTWLFSGSSDASAYHKLSMAGKNAGVSLDSVSAPLTAGKGTGPSFLRIGKTKINLD